MFKRTLMIAMFAVIALGLLAPALGLAQGGVTVTPNRPYINVRLWPAIGADVIGSMETGDVMTATGRTVDGEWLRIDFNGREGWVAALVVAVTGDVNSLPLADPRIIPYNSNTAPNAGGSNLTSIITARLENSGVYLRAGPSLAYPIIANLPRYAEVSVTGRTETGSWVQVTWEGLIGWAAAENLTFYSPSGLSVMNLAVIGPSADTGVRLSDANARFRFLVVDEIRRSLDQARATLDVIEQAWYGVSVGGIPAVCSAPPAPEDFWLTTVERANYPDLGEAVDRFNQGLNDLRNAIQDWLDACLTGGFTPQAVAEGQATFNSARAAFDEVQFRITRSKVVILTAIHAHINYAQDQFERIEAIWLDVRAGLVGSEGDAPCVNLPEQPPDFALTAWESAAYPELIPLVNRLNEGLAVLRRAIQLWQDECNRWNANPSYAMPMDNAVAGYNTMLQARTILNETRDVYLNNAYGSGNVIVPAPSPTPNPVIATILHPPFTPTFTLTPTPGFSFTYSQAFLVSSGNYAPCAWFGIGGNVLGVGGEPMQGALIHVVGGGQDVFVTSGSNRRYGEGGWEVPLRVDAAQFNPYTVRVEDGFGNPLSPSITIRFDENDCALNTALITFVQYQ